VSLTRRLFVAHLAGLAGLGPALAQSTRVPRVGFVSGFSPSESGDLEMLRGGLRELGYVEGRTIAIEAVFTSGDRGRTEAALRAMVEAKTDVIVVRATAAAHAAKRIATATPLVILVSDPLATGLVTSLSRPGGNITGLSLLGPDLAGKRLGYLKAMKPDLKAISFLGDSNDPNGPTFAEQTRLAGEAMGIKVDVVLVPGTGALSADAFDGMAARGSEAVIVQPIFGGSQDRIVSYARRHKIAVVSNYRLFADAGAVFSYGPDDLASAQRAAYYVDRILRGTPPGDLPIEQPTTFRLVINAKAAREMGLSLPPSLTAEAFDVIE
jgi:putative ABC transport system substrate-binding protein